MRNPIRLFAIVLLLVGSIATLAQQILLLGVKEPANCGFATGPLLADLEEIQYPKDWTIVVACTQTSWEQLQRKADAMQTRTGFTNLQNHITALNGQIYREGRPLLGTTHRFPRLVLKHEQGHVLCQCDRETEADRAAGIK